MENNSGAVAEIGSGHTIIEGKYPVIKFFKWSHLPPHLQEVSREFGVLAITLAEKETKNPAEMAVALRKLLEAKDAAVRAAL